MNDDNQDLKYLSQQIRIARNELKNLRNNILKLKKVNEKQVNDVVQLLKNCQTSTNNSLKGSDVHSTHIKLERYADNPRICPIGYVKSMFKSKNGTPRQPSVCSLTKATIHIDKSIFTNPEHALTGLSEFSHIWVIFLFHQNNPDKTNRNFTKSKVHPPRLNGGNVGVFATRSPHRPNPIGLTLTHLDKIEGGVLHLSGVDLLDGTPVLDIKPYIPDYDIPNDISHELEGPTVTDISESKCVSKSDHVSFDKGMIQHCQSAVSPLNFSSLKLCNSVSQAYSEVDKEELPRDNCNECSEINCCENISLERELLQNCSDERKHFNNNLSLLHMIKSQNCIIGDKPTSGQESEDLGESKIKKCVFENCDSSSVSEIGRSTTVASWLSDPPISVLTVGITLRAEKELSDFHGCDTHDGSCKFCLSYFRDVEEAKKTMKDLLQADPRSQYRRQKCSDRLYFLVLDAMHITCWFDSCQPFVEVVKVVPVT